MLDTEIAKEENDKEKGLRHKIGHSKNSSYLK